MESLSCRGIDAVETFFHTSTLAGALESGHREIALLLLKKNARDRGEALIWAAEKGDVDVAAAALAGAGVEPLDLAVARKIAAEKQPEIASLLETATGTRRQSRAEPSVVPADWSAFAGTYRDGELVVFVELRAPQLAVSIGGAEAVLLSQFGERRFEDTEGNMRYDFSHRPLW